MILPTKHLNFSESLLGFGSYILRVLDDPKSVDDIWDKYSMDFKNGLYSARHGFDNLILAIIFLYAIGAVVEKEGEIIKCN